MILPPRRLHLKRLLVKDRVSLALDTGFDPDSVEGLRLVKASRGEGWFYEGGTLRPWTTRGVVQADGHLVVWGDADPVPEGVSPEVWPLQGAEGQAFVQALIGAWTVRAVQSDPLPAFCSSAILPFWTGSAWAFAFPPHELVAVLESLLPLSDRLAWDHYRLPEAGGEASWGFASAALAVQVVEGRLPWTQDDEAHLRQEIRDLKKTLAESELPLGLTGTTRALWFDSLTGRLGAQGLSRWKAWVQDESGWNRTASDADQSQQQESARSRRQGRRSGAAFWRRKGTLVTGLSLAGLLVLFVVGSVVWGAIKPDPTDTWTPEQVVRGYYEHLSVLDSDTLRKLTSFDSSRERNLAGDQEEATNLYVLRQVRIAYERQSPIVEAEAWEQAGRPGLIRGQLLYGIAGLEVRQEGTGFVARYRKWISEVEGEGDPQPFGNAVTDRLTLIRTGKGWKISSLERQRQPLP